MLLAIIYLAVQVVAGTSKPFILNCQEVIQMRKLFRKPKPTRPVSEQYMFGGILAVKSSTVSNSCINDVEVETKTDHIFYANGNIISKSYRNNRLCAISFSKANNTGA